jgi:hypothetical protein
MDVNDIVNIIKDARITKNLIKLYGKWLDMYTVVISHVLVVNILCIIIKCGLCDDVVGYVHG